MDLRTSPKIKGPSTLAMIACTLLCLIVSVTSQASEIAILSGSNKVTGDKFGSSVSISQNYAIAGAPQADSNSLAESGAAYVFSHSGSTWSEAAILTANDGAANNNFGTSVSITDTYAIVGASGASPESISGAGAAYIFSRSGSTWSEQVILTASNKASNSNFGASVCMTDNYAIVGAIGASPDSLSAAGSAYIFSRAGPNWSQQVVITASNKAASSNFGASVSMTDLYAIVGANEATVNGASSAGSAYIFFHSSGVWAEQAIITATTPAANDRFGGSVSMTDNFALIGAPQNDHSSLTDAGAAYLYSRSGTSWTLQTTLTASDNTAGDYFGISVSLSNGYALIGAHLASTDGVSGSGASYFFNRVDNTWTELARIVSSNKQENDNLGQAVAHYETTLFVGNPSASPDSVSDAGAVYVFQYDFPPSASKSEPNPSNSFTEFLGGTTAPDLPTTSPSDSYPILPTNSASPRPAPTQVLGFDSDTAGDFGAAVVAINGSLIISSPNCPDPDNCKGGFVFVLIPGTNSSQVLKGRHRHGNTQFGTTISVGEQWLSITSNSSLYRGTVTPVVSIFTKNPETGLFQRSAGLRPRNVNQPGSDFGTAIATTDVDALIGAPGYDEGGLVDAGATMAFRFRTTVNRWGRNPGVITAFDAAAGDRFGQSVSVVGIFLTVGNRPSDPSHQAVYVLTKSGLEFVHKQKLSNNLKLGFGWVAIMHEDELIISAPEDDNSGSAPNIGSVTMYQRDSNGDYQDYATIYHTPLVSGRRFGHVVARTGDRMVVGTNTCPNGTPCPIPGSAHLYTKIGQGWNPVRSFSSGLSDGSDKFGTVVSVDVDKVVVSAPSGSSSAGTVFAYTA